MRTCAGTGESEPIDARPGGRPTAWSAAAAVSASSGSCAAALCDMRRGFAKVSDSRGLATASVGGAGSSRSAITSLPFASRPETEHK